MGVRRVEVVYGNGQVPNARILHLVRAACALGWDDLQHGSIRGLDEIIAGVCEVDMKLQMIHVPPGESFRIWRGYRCVFQSFEHKLDCIRSGPSDPTNGHCRSLPHSGSPAFPALRIGAEPAFMERMNTFLADFRYSVRRLHRSRGFAACALLSIAL